MQKNFKNFSDVRAICPFYLGLDAEGHVLRCESLIRHSALTVTFQSKVRCQLHAAVLPLLRLKSARCARRWNYKIPSKHRPQARRREQIEERSPFAFNRPRRRVRRGARKPRAVQSRPVASKPRRGERARAHGGRAQCAERACKTHRLKCRSRLAGVRQREGGWSPEDTEPGEVRRSGTAQALARGGAKVWDDHAELRNSAKRRSRNTGPRRGAGRYEGSPVGAETSQVRFAGGAKEGLGEHGRSTVRSHGTPHASEAQCGANAARRPY